MSESKGHASPITKVTDLLFFDNLALHYIVQNTPLEILARVLVSADARLAGSLLGILSIEQREQLHLLMVAVKAKPDPAKDDEAASSLLIVATDQYARGLIRKQGMHYFGTEKSETLKRPEG